MNKITDPLRAQGSRAWLISKLHGRLSHWRTVGPQSLSSEVVWQSRRERGGQGGSMPERPFSNKPACLTPQTLNIILSPRLFVFLLCYQFEVPRKGATIQRIKHTVKAELWQHLSTSDNISLSREVSVSLGSVDHMPNNSVHPACGRIRDTKFPYLSC